MSKIKLAVFENDQIIDEKKLQKDDSIVIGSDPDTVDLFLDRRIVSGNHAKVYFSEGKVFLEDLESTNGTLINGEILVKGQRLEINIGDHVFLGRNKKIKLILLPVQKGTKQLTFEELQTLRQDYVDQKSASPYQLLQHKDRIFIGRDPLCDIHILDPSSSRKHAVISRKGTDFFVEDLSSANGTYLNGRRLEGSHRITASDVLHIGLVEISLEHEAENLASKKAIEADGIEKQYENGYIGLKRMNLSIETGTFVALMGPSGCGKSTLLKAINGDNPPSAGTVKIHGLDLQENFDLLKAKIGYVPQDDIIHRELTVFQSLYFASKLRLPNDLSRQEIETRIDQVLSSLNINDGTIRATPVGSLSGGQRKRVSIAVELLSKPSILFLDEPTSPLDPETIEEFLKCINDLASDGTTIIMVTHKPEDLNYVDKVLFLSTKGYLCFFGEKEEFLPYFDVQSITPVYSLLSEEEQGKVYYKKWLRRSPIYPRPQEKVEITATKKPGFFRQLYWLTVRNWQTKWNSKSALGLLVLQPLLIGLMIAAIFSSYQVSVIFLLAVSAIWFGVSNAAKEIVNEMSIFKRERMVNLGLHSYIFSKIIVQCFIAAIQVAIIVSIVYFKFEWKNLLGVKMFDPLPSFLFLFFVTSSASLLGLLLSSYYSTSEKVMTVVPLALIPQIILAGVVTPITQKVTEICSYFMLGRWATEGMVRIQDGAAPKGKGIVLSMPELHLVSSDVESGQVDLGSSMEFRKVVESGGKFLRLDQPDLLSWFGSLPLNYLVILLLNIAMYILIYMSLKSKDSI